MAKVTIVYRRGNGGFTKGFAHYINGVAKDITSITGLDKFRWHFKALDGTKRSIDWNGSGNISGSNNEQFFFDIPQNFFNVKTNYDCDIEAYDESGGLIYHTQESFLVQVTEPAGVHTDTS